MFLSNDYHCVNANTLIGTTILFSGYPYIWATLLRAHSNSALIRHMAWTSVCMHACMSLLCFELHCYHACSDIHGSMYVNSKLSSEITRLHKRHTHRHTHNAVHMHTHTHTQTHTHTHSCTHSLTHTLTHAHTHTQTQVNTKQYYYN